MISSQTQTLSCTVSRVVHPREPFSDGQPRFCVLLTTAIDNGFEWQIDELEDKMFIIHGIRDPKKIRARRSAP